MIVPMKSFRRALLSLCVLVILQVLPASSYAESNAIRIAGVTKCAPINPFLTSSTMSANLLEIVYDRLVEYSTRDGIRPSLAKKWDVASDGKVWTFFLREGVTFHDGSPFTAHDAKAIYDVLRSMERSAYSLGFSNIEKIDVVSDNVLRVTLKKYDSFFPIFLGQVSMFPRKLLETGIDKMPVVGTGPFRLNAFSPEHIELNANTKYFRGRPHLDEIVVDVYPNQRSSLTQLVAGNADLVFLLDMSDYDVFSDVKDIDSTLTSGVLLYSVFLNVVRRELRSKDVRIALNYAIDRRQIVEGVGREFAKQDLGRFAEVMYQYPYDPKRALELLRAEGWKDSNNDSFLDRNGRVLELTLSIIDSDDVSKKTAQIISDNLEAIGIKLKVDVLPSYEALLTKVMSKRDFDLILAPINMNFGIPMSYLLWHSSQIAKGGNFSMYRNALVDRMLDEIRYNLDAVKRGEARERFVAALKDDPPAIPLFVKRTPVLANTKFMGFSSDPFEFFRSLRNVRIKGDR
jgi:ABC-type transport system substrate-binding protein